MRGCVRLPAPPLRPGDPVRVIAPAGPAREGEIEAGLELLSRRYELRVDPAVRSRKGYLAGDDERRSVELCAAFVEPDVRAIIALRGGYGTMRILRSIAPALGALERNPKAVVGSSDLTALGSAMLCRGLGFIHGPMVETLGRIDEASRERFFRVLEANEPLDESALPLRVLRPGCGRGPVVGGNLTMLAALCGTGYLPELEGCILFLEDVGEKTYRLDRMLTQLLLSGTLDRIAGVLLGELTDCAGESPPEEIVAERLATLGVPILAGFPAAHGAQCFALRMGELAELDGRAGQLRWLPAFAG